MTLADRASRMEGKYYILVSYKTCSLEDNLWFSLLVHLVNFTPLKGANLDVFGQIMLSETDIFWLTTQNRALGMARS